MQVIIVGHHSRSEWIGQLQRALPGTACIMDYSNAGALRGHRAALELASTLHERCIIMEDDAIPVMDFHIRAGRWFSRFPGELISFYLGTGRPARWQRIVDMRLRSARTDHVLINQLLHAVCYSIPPRYVRRILEQIDEPEVDFAIGNAWGKHVLYPVESLVQHRDGPPVETHQDGIARTERRVARRLAGPLMYEG